MKIWIILDDERRGPFTPEQLPVEQMTADTPVWYEGLAGWVTASKAPATAHLFDAGPAVPPTLSSESPAPADSEEVTEEAPADEQPEAADDAPAEDTPAEEAPAEQRPPVPQVPPVAPQPYYYAAPTGPAAPEHKCPPTYLVWSILLTICCCNPVGIIPIITGAQVSSRYRNMDYEGAKKASETTEWWIAIALVLGLMWLPFSIFTTF